MVKLSSIGDIVHALPAAAALKRSIPESEIHWVAEKGAAEILRNNQLLAGLIEVDTKALRRGKKVLGKTMGTAFQQFRELRVPGLDLSIDLQGLYKSAFISKLSGAPRRFGFDPDNLREPGSRVLLTDQISVEPVQNIVYKNIALVENSMRTYLGNADFELDRGEPEFPIAASAEHKQEALAIVEKAAGRIAILNPEGGWVTKLWHAEKYGELADLIWSRLGLTPVLSVGPGSETIAGKVLASSKCERIVRARLSLKGFYELAKRASVYVGGDTGPTHLAVAAGCPVVGIFGPTEWWRNGSIDPDDICVERVDIDCREDCHRRTCGRWICMDISTETVFEAVRKRLEIAESKPQAA